MDMFVISDAMKRFSAWLEAHGRFQAMSAYECATAIDEYEADTGDRLPLPLKSLLTAETPDEAMEAI